MVNFTGCVLYGLACTDYPVPLFEKGNIYVCIGTLLLKVTSSYQGMCGWVILVLTGNGLRVGCQWFHDFISIVVRHVCFRVDNPSNEKTKILLYRYYKTQFFYIFVIFCLWLMLCGFTGDPVCVSSF